MIERLTGIERSKWCYTASSQARVVLALLLSGSILSGLQNFKKRTTLDARSIAKSSIDLRNDASKSTLLIAIPFTAENAGALVENLKGWRQLGPACTPAGSGSTTIERPELWFYVGKLTNVAIKSAFTRIERNLLADPHIRQCFARIRLVSANLTASQDDDYPAGINLMYYKLAMGNVPHADTSNFHSMFWMEPDVFPIKPYWVDKLVDESSSDDQFWIKGSIYKGDIFNSVSGSDWQWIGHINGNALHRLNSPEYARFLRIVMDLEPPTHLWKPFDVSIWKVLHDRPYFWHIYQHIAKRFVYTDFLDHWGFTLSRADIEHSQQRPGVYLVHGGKTSAAASRYMTKFREAGKRRIGLDEQGFVDASRQPVSVFLRADASDIDYAPVAILSVTKHMPGALEIVLASPRADVEMFTTRFATVPKLRVVAEEAIPFTRRNRALQEDYTRGMADTHCRGDFILQLPVDCVLMRPVYHKDLFFEGKPIVAYDKYQRLPVMAALWQASIEEVIGKGWDEVYVSSSTHLFPRGVYAQLRLKLQERHAILFTSFMAKRRGLRHCLERTPADCALARKSRSSSGFFLPVVAGAYMWASMRDQISWLPHNKQDYHQETFLPIIPDYMCHGNSWLARKVNKTAENIRALQRAVSSGSCVQVQALWRPWGKRIVQYIG
jgi:hypothetical protein